MKKIKLASLVLGIAMATSVLGACSNGNTSTEVIGNMSAANAAFQTYTLDSKSVEGSKLIDRVYAPVEMATTKTGGYTSYAVDSNANTKWESASDAATKQIVFRFESVYPLANISADFVCADDVVSLEYSEDGVNWKNLGELKAETSCRGEYARYVKLSSASQFTINDISFYRPAGVTVTGGKPEGIADIATEVSSGNVSVQNGDIELTFAPSAIYKIMLAPKNGAMPEEITFSYLDADTNAWTEMETAKQLSSIQGVQIFEFDVVYTTSVKMSVKGSITLEALSVYEWDTHSSTWVAVDGYDRRVAEYSDLSYGPRQNKYVGMFYFLWNFGSRYGVGPYDVTKIEEQYPDMLETGRGLGTELDWHHWGESAYGYFNQNDEWVVRKDAQMLADSGVDVLFIDNTNITTLAGNVEVWSYKKQLFTLLDTFLEIQKKGGKVPKFCLYGPATEEGASLKVFLDFWWENMYAEGKYKDLWFTFDNGKPVLLAYKHYITDQKYLDFFEVKTPTGGGISPGDDPANNQGFKDQWDWYTGYPQNAHYSEYDPYEQMSASVAQNIVIDKNSEPDRSDYYYITAFSDGKARGRDYSNGKAADPEDLERAIGEGWNFQEQLDRVLELDPRVTWVTGWNEWVMYRLKDWWGLQAPVLFVDAYNYRYNRDIQPMKGKYGDATYYQFTDFVRKYKGAEPIPVYETGKTISDWTDWLGVPSVYYDDIGDVTHRNYVGFNLKDRYTNDSGRNDIILSKTTYDDENVYFYVKTADSLTPYTDNAWMRLFIKTAGSGWCGYDYVLNKTTGSKKTLILEKFKAGSWETAESWEVSYQLKDRELMVTIPRSALGMENGVNFEFKWADNMQGNENTDEFMLNGDAAPNNRFNYAFRSRQVENKQPEIILGSARTR